MQTTKKTITTSIQSVCPICQYVFPICKNKSFELKLQKIHANKTHVINDFKRLPPFPIESLKGEKVNPSLKSKIINKISII